jgi:hypothetical protein
MDTAEGFSLEGEGIELENIAGDAAGSDAPEEDLFEEEEDVIAQMIREMGEERAADKHLPPKLSH